MTSTPAASAPLVGKRILVTRTREQGSALVSALVERGAIPLELPTIEIVPPADWDPVDRAIQNLSAYDWIVFSSANAVRFFLDRLQPHGSSQTPRIAAIGPATARAIADRGLTVDLVPASYVAEAVVAELATSDLANRSVLIPSAQDTRDVLAEGLADAGARVDRVVVYRTVPAGDPEIAGRLFAEGQIDVVTFTSSSTARNLLGLLGDKGPALLRSVVIASIGPITSATARDLGLTVRIEAGEHTIPGLVAAMEQYYRQV